VPLHVQVNPPEGGLREQSYVMCEAARSISVLRLVDRWGVVTAQTMAQIEDRLKILFEL
jgi:mRNA interferase MazF